MAYCASNQACFKVFYHFGPLLVIFQLFWYFSSLDQLIKLEFLNLTSLHACGDTQTPPQHTILTDWWTPYQLPGNSLFQPGKVCLINFIDHGYEAEKGKYGNSELGIGTKWNRQPTRIFQLLEAFCCPGCCGILTKYSKCFLPLKNFKKGV